MTRWLFTSIIQNTYLIVGLILLTIGTNMTTVFCVKSKIAFKGDRGRNACAYCKSPYIRTLNFRGQAAVGSHLMITNPVLK